MRKLRPILARVLIAALIGAVVTVGVAVGCAWREAGSRIPYPNYVYWRDTRTDDVYSWSRWKEGAGTRLGSLQAHGKWTSFFVGRADVIGTCPFPVVATARDFHGGCRAIRIAGWPMECIWGSVDFNTIADRRTPYSGARSPYDWAGCGVIAIGRRIDIADHHGVCGQLPIAPIWSGLAINTLFYGTIAWALMFLPGTLRRWRRRRLGRCVKCGYDRAGLSAVAACPECGCAGGR